MSIPFCLRTTDGKRIGDYATDDAIAWHPGMVLFYNEHQYKILEVEYLIGYYNGKDESIDRNEGINLVVELVN